MQELSTDSKVTFRRVLGSAEVLPTRPGIDPLEDTRPMPDLSRISQSPITSICHRASVYAAWVGASCGVACFRPSVGTFRPSAGSLVNTWPAQGKTPNSTFDRRWRLDRLNILINKISVRSLTLLIFTCTIGWAACGRRQPGHESMMLACTVVFTVKCLIR